MRDYLAAHWRDTLAANQLNGFEALWTLDIPWIEKPNERRGGWSGVSPLVLSLPSGAKVQLILKRQQNHITKTLLHPMRGIPTFAREMRNILRFKQHNIPALEPVYFGQRCDGNELRAILITVALSGFQSLETLVDEWQRTGWPDRAERIKTMHAIALVMQRMHAARLQHNCFYPKHIFLRPTETSDGYECRIIDLEKVKRRPFRWLAALRDLYTLNRHSQDWSRTDRLRFFLIYFDIKRLNSRAKWIWRRIARRTIVKGRVAITPSTEQ